MGLQDSVLYSLAKHWPSPVLEMVRRLGAEPGTDAYSMAYAQDEFNRKVRSGLQIDVSGLDVLEIGCGRGGISCFMAVVGAHSVIAIAINQKHLTHAEEFSQELAARFGKDYLLPVKFIEMDAGRMNFGSFDLVVADNVFEHLPDPNRVVKECFRVLRPGGRILIPVFSSIFSKYGLHLKHGLKLPWANLFFSEKTIIRAMFRLAKDNPKLWDLYPRLSQFLREQSMN